MSTHHSRPWYVSNRFTDEWKRDAERGVDLRMQKAKAWIRAMVVNLGFIAMVLYGLWLGGDPTYITVFGVASLALYNGIELGDYLSLLQAIAEAKSDNND